MNKDQVAGRVDQSLGKVKEAALHYNADILLTTSRRTPPEIDGIVVKELRNFERSALCIIANSNNSPYAVGGILGLADLLIVSGETSEFFAVENGEVKAYATFPQGRHTRVH